MWSGVTACYCMQAIQCNLVWLHAIACKLSDAIYANYPMQSGVAAWYCMQAVRCSLVQLHVITCRLSDAIWCCCMPLHASYPMQSSAAICHCMQTIWCSLVWQHSIAYKLSDALWCNCMKSHVCSPMHFPDYGTVVIRCVSASCMLLNAFLVWLHVAAHRLSNALWYCCTGCVAAHHHPMYNSTAACHCSSANTTLSWIMSNLCILFSIHTKLLVTPPHALRSITSSNVCYSQAEQLDSACI